MSTDLRLPGLPADDRRSIPADTPYNATANALPTPGHGGSLGGTTGYRNPEEANAGCARTACNNPADGSKFFGFGMDPDDPRAPSRHAAQRHFPLPRTSVGNAPRNAAPAPADKRASARWPDTSARDASLVLPCSAPSSTPLVSLYLLPVSLSDLTGRGGLLR